MAAAADSRAWECLLQAICWRRLAAAGREGENASWTEKNSGAAEAET